MWDDLRNAYPLREHLSKLYPLWVHLKKNKAIPFRDYNSLKNVFSIYQFSFFSKNKIPFKSSHLNYYKTIFVLKCPITVLHISLGVDTVNSSPNKSCCVALLTILHHTRSCSTTPLTIPQHTRSCSTTPLTIFHQAR